MPVRLIHDDTSNPRPQKQSIPMMLAKTLTYRHTGCISCISPTYPNTLNAKLRHTSLIYYSGKTRHSAYASTTCEKAAVKKRHGICSTTKKNKGLTLLEILVVLVIVSITSTLIFQSLWQLMHLQNRLQQSDQKNESMVLESDWFRQIISSIYISTSNKEDLTGTDALLKGWTFSPLSSLIGAPTRFQLEIKRDPATGSSKLTYEDEYSARQTLIDFGTARVSFTYLDETGEKHQVWPPAFSSEKILPRNVILNIVGKQGIESIVATPMAASTAPQKTINPFEAEP